MTGGGLDSPRWAPVWSRALSRAFAGMRETGDSACALRELAGQRAEPHEPSGGHQAAHRQAHGTRAVSRERRRVNRGRWVSHGDLHKGGECGAGRSRGAGLGHLIPQVQFEQPSLAAACEQSHQFLPSVSRLFREFPVRGKAPCSVCLSHPCVGTSALQDSSF